jgi:hypothetical protein
VVDEHADVVVFHQPLHGDALVVALQARRRRCWCVTASPSGRSAGQSSSSPLAARLMFTGTRNTTSLTFDAFGALAARQIPVSHTEWGPSKDQHP